MTVLRNCGLTICTAQVVPDVVQERRDALKNSGIGKMVMFLYKLPDETPANRKMAKQIVERWSRPIFESHRDPRCISSKQHVLVLQ